MAATPLVRRQRCLFPQNRVPLFPRTGPCESARQTFRQRPAEQRLSTAGL